MKKYILLSCLAFTLTSCKKEISKKEIVKSETDTSNYTDSKNSLQKDFEKSINNPKVKIIKVNEKEVTKEDALKIDLFNVSSTTLIIHKPDSMTFKVELEKPKYIKSE